MAKLVPTIIQRLFITIGTRTALVSDSLVPLVCLTVLVAATVTRSVVSRKSTKSLELMRKNNF